MATHLGAATTLSPDDVPTDLVARASVVLLEGYLWTSRRQGGDAPRRGGRPRHDGSVALSLSDPFCVERHQREFLDLLLDDVDVLFGNEEEIARLFGSSDVRRRPRRGRGDRPARRRDPWRAGRVVLTARGPVAVPAAPVSGSSTPPAPATSTRPASSTG